VFKIAIVFGFGSSEYKICFIVQLAKFSFSLQVDVRRNYHLGRGTSSRSVVVDVLDGPRFGGIRGGVCPNVWIPAEYGTSFIAGVWQGVCCWARSL
jgi:hypothetical protein